MTVPPFMSRAWAFLFNNVYAHDVHKRWLTLRIIRFRHLRPPLPQERTTGSPYPSRRTIIRTGSVASLLRPGPPPGLTLFMGLDKTGCVRSRRRSYGVPERLMYIQYTSPLCALYLRLRLAGVAFGPVRLADGPPSVRAVLAQLRRCAQAYVRLVGQRPAPRTAPSRALHMGLRLLGRLGGGCCAAPLV